MATALIAGAELAGEISPLGRNRILVAGSHPLYRRLLTQILVHAGCTTDLADSAEDAIASFKRHSYAMVILEADGLRMDGYEIARHIRRIEDHGRRTPIIALTADTLQSDRKKRKAAGIDNYIAKPIRPGSVESVLARYTQPDSEETAPPAQLAAIDEHCLSDLLAMVDGDTQQLKDLIDAFLLDGSELLDTLRRAEEDGNLGMLWEAARALKSISGQMGVGRIHAICGTIEALANTGSTAGVDALLQELSLAHERARRDLRDVALVPALPAERRRRAPAAPGEILVAESDPLTARFLITALNNSGFRVTHVTDGDAAVALLASHAFQALVVAAALPGVDGFGVLSQARLLPQYERTPVILLSSRGGEQDVLRAFDLGADDFIATPFNPLEVVRRIHKRIRSA